MPVYSRLSDIPNVNGSRLCDLQGSLRATAALSLWSGQDSNLRKGASFPRPRA